MSTNRIQEGTTINVIAPTGGYGPGDVHVLRSGSTGQIAVSIDNVTAGQSGPAETTGVFELPAVTGTSFGPGDTLYWDASGSELTNTASGNTLAGTCWLAKASATNTARVKINA